MEEVAKAIGMDQRIGSKFLKASVGEENLRKVRTERNRDPDLASELFCVPAQVSVEAVSRRTC